MNGVTGDEPPMDALTAAAVETARHTADDAWGKAPRLYALAEKAELTRLGVDDLPEQVRSAPEDALIPLEQDPLPLGEPIEVLATIHWPAEVAGCVLVTEVKVLPGSESWAAEYPGGRRARLTVGVLRESEEEARYACCLLLDGDDVLRVGPDLADDLVTALLGTF